MATRLWTTCSSQCMPAPPHRHPDAKDCIVPSRRAARGLAACSLGGVRPRQFASSQQGWPVAIADPSATQPYSTRLRATTLQGYTATKARGCRLQDTGHMVQAHGTTRGHRGYWPQGLQGYRPQATGHRPQAGDDRLKAMATRHMLQVMGHRPWGHRPQTGRIGGFVSVAVMQHLGDSEGQWASGCCWLICRGGHGRVDIDELVVWLL